MAGGESEAHLDLKRAALHWAPSVSIDEGLRRLAEHYAPTR